MGNTAKQEGRAGAGAGAPLSRRGFVAGLGGVAVTLAVGGVAAAAPQSDAVLYPPGAMDRRLFSALCIRCDRCRSACPVGAIGVAKVEDGLLQARLPKMEFRLSYCDACDGAYRCVEACPTGALQPFDTSRDKVGIAVIDQAKCQVFGMSATCGKVCIATCPAQAIAETPDGRIAVDENACWGCGACEFVCPTNAYRSYDGNTSRGINVKVWQGGRS